ncbi:hypothetical protein METBIDRAFT_38022 [Metschnikowia bicuspidata var. bicuspidata NRRL YB-4993]|uniref:Endoplasmic reticulum transmembrane protein n=1 Tax=Metschnikowia bicuspidata var. bicuspidata NRRL YB-4993 TaxID=869754 RepID=A0A1A0HFD0_9ASCO|nr:hypothetical protein METBIDRAFT_38022 [Metschnikowia bicuspidata var. bicuspidata NRRL YB-4993]OBA22690.1 hypothetical protein METBIDRAFT_38022 [Metschnikowia bicuspidata var. bicuspidata NRRL YB-4993]
MSIQMAMVFGALVAQMAVIALLLLPLPHMIRAKIVRGWAALRQNANYKVGLLFVSGLMVLQFADCVQKLQKYLRRESPEAVLNPSMGVGLLSDKLASKFYAQRNLYLSGAVLYLGLTIHTVLLIMGKLVAKEVLCRSAHNENTKDDSEEIVALKETIRKREVEIAAMKKQIEGVQKAYDGLSASSERSKDD